MRKIHRNLPILFQPEPWRVTEREFSPQSNLANETVFAVANGYLGLRGTFEEGYYMGSEGSDPAAVVNGIYEYHDYHYIWRRPGFPPRSHNIVRQVNPIDIRVRIDGESVMLGTSVSEYSRTIDFRTGVLTRSFVYRTAGGARVRMTYERFASQVEKHLLAVRVTAEALEPCTVTLTGTLANAVNPELPKNGIGEHFLECFENRETLRGRTPIAGDASSASCSVTYATKVSGFRMACAVCDRTEGGKAPRFEDDDAILRTVREKRLDAGERLVYERFVAYASDRDFEDFRAHAEQLAQEGLSKGFEAHGRRNTAYWENFWRTADVQIEGDPLIQQGIRFSIFHTNQSTGKDGITNISANGLAGCAYSGHTFWDTEIFILPMFLYTEPQVARQLLKYRYGILDNARKRAREMGGVGALYAWNSINGEECGFIFEAVTAQYHIDNAVYYAIYRYMEATEDREFLREYGAEMLFETARFMAHRGVFVEARGNKFCINVVCGPDEYSPIVDNNCYTNWMTKHHLEYALEAAALLEREYPADMARLREKCGLDEAELALWKRAAENMYLPYNEEYGMYMQDDQFMYRDPVDLDAISPDELPLLFTKHPLNLWRMQVAKQADLVLLTFLWSEEFTPEMKRRIFDYMEPRTIHDSSLSAGIHSIVACDIGYENEAYGYLKQSCRMDLENYNRNTGSGIHAACMGSSWMMIVNGYAGLRVVKGELHFKPYCPEQWKSYSFKLRFRGRLLAVTVKAGGAEFLLLEGQPISVFSEGREIALTPRTEAK